MQLTIKIIVIILFFTSFGCIKKQPQLPANKNQTIDSTLLTLQLANEKLISQEDSLLSEYVAKDSTQYLKDKNGYWYCIFYNKTKNLNWETAQIEYSAYSMNNAFFYNKVELIKLEKNQLIPTLQKLIKKMSPGDSAIAIAPWYLAYGLNGNDKVPPYTSLKIKLKLIKK